MSRRFRRNTTTKSKEGVTAKVWGWRLALLALIVFSLAAAALKNRQRRNPATRNGEAY